jgi:hypothetical protein
VLVSNPPGEAFRRSIFGELTDHGFDTMLLETYRLNQALVEWPNRQFYAGRLQPVEGVVDRTIAYPRQLARFAEVLRSDRPMSTHEGCTHHHPPRKPCSVLRIANRARRGPRRGCLTPRKSPYSM